MGSKVIIIGGGIAGLSAGIYAQLNGLQSEIHEKHSIVGGQCTGWIRKGYKIDNCVHWLTGTNPETEVNQVWKETGVLSYNNDDIIQHESFLQIEKDGQTINIWKDLGRLEKDMIAISPEDSEQIKEFVHLIDVYRGVVMPGRKPVDMFSILDYARMLMKMKNVGKVHGKLSKISLEDYSKRFKHPLLQKMVTAYMPKTYNVASMFFVYGTFCDGNGALPKGGTFGMVDRMLEKYIALGGKVVTNHEATRIDILKGKARKVYFKDGEEVETENLVLACDTAETFYKLLNPSYMDKHFKARYNDTEGKYPLYTSFNCYLGLDMKASEVMDQVTQDIELKSPIKIAESMAEDILIKNFDYEPSYAPEGKSVLQIMAMQYENDFSYWERLYFEDRKRYRQEKSEVMDAMKSAVEQRFPQFKGKLEILDAATPMTHHRFCNAYKGAYMSFILSTKAKKENHNGRVPGLKNVYLAGQWLQSPGGLPNAVVTGKFAIQRLCKRLGIPFKSC